MTQHVRLGQQLYYFNPAILQRIGWTDGYGGRGSGPYLAIVTNNLGSGLTLQVYLPGVVPIEQTQVPFVDDARSLDKDKGYWDFPDALAKARFLKARAAAVAEEAALSAADKPVEAPVASQSGLDPRSVPTVASGAPLE